ncbi:MFS family permease [Pseudomonas syringae pv. actinidiae]|uniref:MFS family permease n=1 Tax=Pseudomonas syringae pv. actinidiae TaxID=103796 RepID=A0AAN4Q7L5_PSESF|nr:MFS family permease [Pseudomonas syringae pv. actinidiae]
MKAHHLRLQALDQCAGVAVERRSIGNRRRRIEVGAQCLVIGLEGLLPAFSPLGIVVWGRVAEKIQIERGASGVLSKNRYFLSDLIERQHGAGQRSQTSCFSYSDGHRRTAGAGHRCLQNRHFNVEQFKNASIRPLAHVFSTSLAIRQRSLSVRRP